MISVAHLSVIQKASNSNDLVWPSHNAEAGKFMHRQQTRGLQTHAIPRLMHLTSIIVLASSRIAHVRALSLSLSCCS